MKYNGALSKGTIPGYGTIRGDYDKRRNFAYLSMQKPRESLLGSIKTSDEVNKTNDIPVTEYRTTVKGVEICS